MQPIKAILADDEEISWKTLQNLLQMVSVPVEIQAVAKNVAETVAAIKTHDPDLLFLDIAMPDGDGFKVLEQTEDYAYEVIFITAHHEYAIRAFEFAALHYLLKPVNVTDLNEVLERFENRRKNKSYTERFNILKNGLKDQYSKIALPTQDSILFVDVEDIIRCEASHNYTIFYLKNGSHVIMSKSLRHYEQLLSNHTFFRIHDKHLVNLRYVAKYQRGKGGSAVLTDGSELEVSVRKKDDFLKQIANHT